MPLVSPRMVHRAAGAVLVCLAGHAASAAPAIYSLGTFGGTASYGLAINDAGQVTGTSYFSGNTPFHAYRYDGIPDSGGVMRDLGTLGGTNSSGSGVNDAAQVAG